MKTFKLLTPLVAIFLTLNINAQVTFDMSLSETSSKHKVVVHSDSTNYPDTLVVKGYVAAHKKGICGDICAGGTIKFELLEKIEGYPHSYMYIVTACTTGETNKETITLYVTHYTGKELECYYKDVVEIIDSKGVPYYKTTIEETKKITIQ